MALLSYSEYNYALQTSTVCTSCTAWYACIIESHGSL